MPAQFRIQFAPQVTTPLCAGCGCGKPCPCDRDLVVLPRQRAEQLDRELEHLRSHSKDPDLADDLIAQLIQLCHPDRHPEERNTLATKVTARLTSMRQRRKKG